MDYEVVPRPKSLIGCLTHLGTTLVYTNEKNVRGMIQ